MNEILRTDQEQNLLLWEAIRPAISTLTPTRDICQNNHKGNVHSEAAHAKGSKGADKAKSLILGQLARSNGLSCEALETLTGLSHQTCSARCSELKKDGLIVVCGKTTTRSGSPCAVYRLWNETPTALSESNARRQAS